MCEENSIAELLETMTDEPEKVINEFIEIMKDSDNESVFESINYVWGGEFVDSKICKDHKILNKFPHILFNTKTKKFQYPKHKDGRYIVNADGTKVMHVLVAREFLNYNTMIKGDIKFKDNNKFNYSIDNLILPSKEIKQTDKKNTKQPQIIEHPDGSISIAEPEKESNGNIITRDDVKDSIIDIRSTITITDIRMKTPCNIISNIEWINVIKDLRSVFVFIDSTPELYIFKDMVFDPSTKKNIMKPIVTDESTARSKLNKLPIGIYNGKEISAWDVFKKFIHLFAYKYMTFYDPSDENVFSLFRGWYWNEQETINYELINNFLNFIKEIIANNDDKVYEYIIKWIAKLFQNPGVKLQTMIVLTGKQGCGKNTFTNIISTVARGYSKPNVTSIDHVSGKFNSSLLGMILMVGNEWTSASLNKHIDKGRHKAVITEETIEIERKGHDPFTSLNTANFIINSNEQDPVIIEANDRRHVVTEVSDKYLQNEEYFSQFNNLSNEFYNHLYTYFINMDITNWSERNIPMTAPKEIIMNKHNDVYMSFIKHMREKIEKTSKVTKKTGENETYKLFANFAQQNGFGVPKLTTFEAEMKKYTFTKQHSVDNRRITTYIIKDEIVEKIKKDVPDIIVPLTEDEIQYRKTFNIGDDNNDE